MANHFKDRPMRDSYDNCVTMYKTKHRNLFNGDVRSRGNGIADMFWMGFDSKTPGCGWDVASKKMLAYAFWRAGQDCAKHSLAAG